MNKISKLWSKFSDNWFGNKEGLHCHWCKHTDNYDGSVYCKYVDRGFDDNKWIPDWAGTHCAKKCPYFEIHDWYTKDENFYISFPKARR